jgi:hypothetical protein
LYSSILTGFDGEDPDEARMLYLRNSKLTGSIWQLFILKSLKLSGCRVVFNNASLKQKLGEFSIDNLDQEKIENICAGLASQRLLQRWRIIMQETTNIYIHARGHGGRHRRAKAYSL